MIASNEPPCGVLFETFKNYAGVSNRDLALVVLSDTPVAGGRSYRQRIVEDKTFLSRSVVHSSPGALPPSAFADFRKSAQHLYSMIRSTSRKGLSAAQIHELFSGKAAQDMAEACRVYGLDNALYLNAVNRIAALGGVGVTDRALLLVLLFLEVGCLQDTRKAVSDVLLLSERSLQAEPVTQTAAPFETPARVDKPHDEDVRLALFRVQGSRISGKPHVLSIGPQGTEIGYLSTTADSITDVEETVSRRHLLVYRAESGEWYARGLHSRNGTKLISGSDRSEIEIEPPRDRAKGFEPVDVVVKPGDKLVLARDTVFMVMQIDPESV